LINEKINDIAGKMGMRERESERNRKNTIIVEQVNKDK